MDKNISQCQIDLNQHGFFLYPLSLPATLKQVVLNEDFEQIDRIIKNLVSKNQLIWKFMRKFCPVESIEHIATKLGVVLIVLGAMHFFNMYNINKIRSKRTKSEGYANA